MADVSAKNVSLGSYTVSIENIISIFDGLSSVVQEQADIEVARWRRPPDQSEEDFEKAKADARNRAYKVTATLKFSDGSSSFIQSSDMIRKEPQGPELSLVFMTNTTAFFSAANVQPTNQFNLSLDFSQPPLLDANTFISGPTRNGSGLNIEGDRPGWLAGIEKTVVERIDKRHNLRKFLHGHFIYDYGLLGFGAPLALYFCWLSMGFIQQNAKYWPILQAAAFVYIFFVGLWIYRILFSYLRWAYPLAELKEQLSRPRKHRIFWWSIVTLLGGKVFWDLVDPLLSIRAFLRVLNY